MREFRLVALLLSICVGCGGGGGNNEVIAEQDELAAYVAENPSPTDEELMAGMADDQEE
ncbi:hypothetical protein Poly51_20290 [Rubripirellula tenax]|uniref:Uncharacterized protein n=1 Tax=Rubripirellula tenax TaxID=2528015 RepID=A0A5C6FBX4_9BACT|nr:hypothetical protein Poly51_20290 [Rubripirellula tenax]